MDSRPAPWLGHPSGQEELALMKIGLGNHQDSAPLRRGLGWRLGHACTG